VQLESGSSRVPKGIEGLGGDPVDHPGRSQRRNRWFQGSAVGRHEV